MLRKIFLALLILGFLPTIFSAKNVFDISVVDINQQDYTYTITVGLNQHVKDYQEYDVYIRETISDTIIYSTTVGNEGAQSTTYDFPLGKTIFGDYEVVFRTKYVNEKYYQEKDYFKLEYESSFIPYEVIFPNVVIFDDKNSVLNINATIENRISEVLNFEFEIYPKSKPELIETKTFSCGEEVCNFSFELDSQIVLGDYFVKIYNPYKETTESFKVVFSDSEKRKKFLNELSSEKKEKYANLFLKNRKNNSLNAEMKIIKNNSEIDLKNIELNELVDVEFSFKEKSVKKIVVPQILLADFEITYDEVELSEINIENGVNSFFINPKLPIESEIYQIQYEAKGNQLLKCVNYDFDSKVCLSGFEIVKNTIPGKEYLINFTPEDPLFVETKNFYYDVQKGDLTMGGTLEEKEINSVDLSNSFVIFSARTSSRNPEDNQITPSFVNSTTLKFERYNNGGTSEINWQVISGNKFEVQRGEETLSSGSSFVSVPINEVNLSSTFVIVYGRCDSGSRNNNFAGYFSGKFIDSTTLELKRGNEDLCDATVSWQVVEYSGSNVISGDTSFTNSGTTLIESTSSFVQEDSFLIFSWASIGSDPGMDTNRIRGYISDIDEITFNRDNDAGNSQRDISWFVVEHEDLKTQSGTLSFNSDIDNPIFPVSNVSGSFYISSEENTGGGTNYVNALHIINMTNSSNLFFDKQTNAQTITSSWQVIEFEKTSLEQSQVLLHSTSSANLTSDDLICFFELDSSVNNVAVNWFKNSNSLMLVYLPMEGNETNALKDFSGNNLSLISGGTLWSPAAGFDGNGSFIFSGDDYLRFSSFSGLAGKSSATISGWVKQDSNSQNQYFLWANGNALIQFGDNYNIPSSTNLRVRWNLDGGWRNSHTVENILDTSWHHWAFVFDFGTTRIYRDGINVYTGTDTQTSFSTSNPDFYFGYRGGQGGFYGSMDDLRIFNYSLSQNQIKKLAENNLSVIDSGETKIGEKWQCQVTTFGLEILGETMFSNEIIINNESEINETIAEVILYSDSLLNHTTDDLTCSFNSIFDLGSTAVSWFINNDSWFETYYPFEGNSSVALFDFSGNLHDLTASATSPVWNNSTGFDGNGSFYFTGSWTSLVDEDAENYLNGLDELTVSVRIKSDVIGTDSGILVGKDPDGSDNIFGLRYDDVGWLNNSMREGIKIGLGDGSYESASYVQTDLWQHIVFSWRRGEEIELYIDGVKDIPSGSNIPSNNSLSGLTKLIVGKGVKDTGSNSWQGYIDELHIFPEKLSEEQILRLFNNKPEIASNQTSTNENWQCVVTTFSSNSSVSYDSNFLTINSFTSDQEFLDFLKTVPEENLSQYFLYDSQNNSVPANVSFYKDGSKVSLNNITIYDLVDVEFILEDEYVKRIVVPKVFISNFTIGFERVDTAKVELDDVSSAFAIDPKLPIEAKNYSVEFYAKGLEFFKCKDYNFSSQTCFGTHEKLMNLTPGNLYFLTFKPEDPLFSEVGDILDTWYDSNWDRRRGITINSSMVNGSHTDFPMYVDISADTDLATYAQSDGDDILFTDSDGKTKLSHEIELYNSSSGKLLAWVKLPFLTNNSDKIIYMYYNNSIASRQENISEVWTNNYLHVYHLQQTPTGLSGDIFDSAGNYNGTSSSLTSSQVSGQIGNALNFAPYSNAIIASSTTSLSELTYSAWGTNTGGGTFPRFLEKSTSIRTDGGSIRFNNQNTNLLLETNGNWNYFAVTGNSTNKQAFIFNTSRQRQYFIDSGSFTETGIETLYVGNRGIGSRQYNGILDEVRISSTVRTPEWLHTEFNNQFDFSSFATLSEGVDIFRPIISNLDLSATSSDNLTTDNLTCNFDFNTTATTAAVSWHINSTPMMSLYMPFEGNSSNALLDYSGNSNDGGNNGAVWNEGSGFDDNGSFYFGGNDYISVPYDDTLNFSGAGEEFTLSAWINITDLSHDGGIIGRWQGIGHHQYVLKFESDTNNIKFAVYDNTYIVAQSQDNSISKNTWAHVVGVANGTNLNVYVNGVESFKSTPAYNTISDVGTDILTIGEEGDSPNNYFEGSIDDVRVYDRALSLEQINALYNERADLIVGDETEVYDVWQCRVTPFSYFTAGLTYSSNNITIIDAPKISNLLLNATSQNNLTTDDLTCNYDLNGSATTAAINWYKDSEPIMAFYMPMEGNEINALKDYSGNGIEIINENVSWNSTWGYDGNGSFHFTNETKMSTNGTGPEVSGDFTVTFWLKTNNFTDTKQSMVLMDSTWSTKEGWGFLDDGQWYNVFTFRIMGSGGHDDMRVSRSVVNDNSWHFVVGRLTERTGELIVDNVVRDSSTSVNFDPDAGDLDIGSDGSNSYFDGYLDDIRVYNYSLSDEQITALYESKADVIKSSETEIGEVWQCRVTPFDLEKAGKTYISNNITIEGANLYLRLTGKNEDYGSFLSYNINLSNLQSNPTPENQYVKFYMYVPNDYDIISNFSFSTSSYYTTTYENMSLPGGKIYQFTIEGITAQNSSLDSFEGISNSDNAWSLDFNFTGGLPQNILLGMDPEK